MCLYPEQQESGAEGGIDYLTYICCYTYDLYHMYLAETIS